MLMSCICLVPCAVTLHGTPKLVMRLLLLSKCSTSAFIRGICASREASVVCSLTLAARHCRTVGAHSHLIARASALLRTCLASEHTTACAHGVAAPSMPWHHTDPQVMLKHRHNFWIAKGLDELGFEPRQPKLWQLECHPLDLSGIHPGCDCHQ